MTSRRRRVLIVSSVVVLLLGGLWWLIRPRIDPRFIGTWSWRIDMGPGPALIMDGNTMAIITLNADGSGSTQQPNRRGPIIPIRWSVGRNGEFRFTTGLMQESLYLWMFVRARVFGESFVEMPRWRTVSVADDRIEFDIGGDPAPEFVFKRVSPEDLAR